MFSIDNFITLGLLVMLQVVLGFDNLLYISLASKRAPADKQAMVRRLGIALAIGLRIGLLFVLIQLIESFQGPLFEIRLGEMVYGSFSGHSLIVLVGGGFIIYTSTKEVLHMMRLEQDAHEDRNPQTVARAIFWIVLMNLVFSFDSILSAMALSDVMWVMTTAIVIGGLLMIWMADSVSTFLQKNRMYEVLGLFVLFVVGIMLVTEGGHLAHLELFGNEITAMSKTTFYFVIGVLALCEIVQSRYQRKLFGHSGDGNGAAAKG